MQGLHTKCFKEETIMTQPRKNIVSISDTPYYHCIGRCVRRAYLCGFDEFSGKSFEHRRQWIVDRLNYLAEVFSIDICAYAVMSNHYHLVLRLSPSKSNKWTQNEVIEHWQQLYSGGELVKAYQAGEAQTKEQRAALDIKIEVWRERLSDISWFMRCLNEHIAILANKEDECTGRFWEGRFKSQALLDEAALISCMAYVDLNPVRAKMAKTPEQSDYTSVKERVRQHLGKSHAANNLLKMDGDINSSTGLPLQLEDYLKLIDWTGRMVIGGKKGLIPNQLKPIMERLHLKSDTWLEQQKYFGKRYFLVAGSRDKIKVLALKIGVKWMNGQGSCSPFGLPT